MIYMEYSKSKNVVYTINDETKIVVARLSCSIRDAQTMFNSVLNRFIKSRNGVSPVAEADLAMYTLPKCSYVGIARCHPDDEFDIEFGKRLALTRAKNKYLHAVNIQLSKIQEWFLSMHAIVDSIYDKNYRKEIDSKVETYHMENKVEGVINDR